MFSHFFACTPSTCDIVYMQKVHMIVNHLEMKQIEHNSGKSVSELMETAGRAVAAELLELSRPGSIILMLAGKGNNGGDAFTAAGYLKDQGRICRVILLCGGPAADAAAEAFRRLDPSDIVPASSLEKELAGADMVVDAVFGFGFHGSLSKELKHAFRMVNRCGKPIYSIDINSGAESDSDAHDSDAVRSDVTFALDCYKPFHMLRKEHQLFRETKLLDLGLPHDIPTEYYEMNEDLFFAGIPEKQEDAYKGTFGKITLVSGSYGMAGAACLNLLGARAMGAGYINCALPEEIYPIAASQFMSVVFHPFREDYWIEQILPLISTSKAIGFGSGAVYMPKKRDVMDLILQYSKCPVVLDAEALRLMIHNTYLFRFVKAPVIITPHIGEFADLIQKPIPYVQDHKVELAADFARDYRVIVVLKGANTIVAGPAGEMYFNQSGNAALAQAGSGDLLTGIMTALLSYNCDTFRAVCMAVWIHGYLADLAVQKHSIRGFDFSMIPSIMDELFNKHGF